MFILFVILSRHSKSAYTSVLRSIANSPKISIETQMKTLNDKQQFRKTLDVFDKHKGKYQTMITDRVVVQALKACARLGSLDRGQTIHQKLSDNLLNNAYVQTSLIHFYMQCGRVNDAQRVFESSTDKTLIHYGSMMKGYITNNMSEKSIQLFSKIPKPDEILFCLLFNSCAHTRTKHALNIGRQVWSQLSSVNQRNQFILNAALDMFIKCGDVSSAESITFAKTKRNVIDYGQLMKYYNDHRKPVNTLNLYEKMKSEGIEANAVIFLLLIDACVEIGLKSRCQSIAEQIPSTMSTDLKIQSALVHMWGKVGCVNQAKQVFQQIDKPNSVTYTAMINAYGLNGMGHDALELYYQMPSEMIVEKTYVCILNACSHSGLVEEARSIFSKIPKKDEWIYTAMIDCLCRSFIFDEAKQLIEKYENNHRPCLPMYKSLLSGARNRTDVSMARQTIHRIRQLFRGMDKSLASASVLLTNTLASAGELEEALQIRSKLSETGVKKQMGLSWTEANGEIVQFRAQDRSHARTQEIYDELQRIEHELIEHGHKFDASWITRPIMPDETVESILNSHSERLALAFNFIQRPIPPQIQIVKNLRICGDCHRAIKLISQIRHCEIVIRDANRIHHFSHGKCSCNDHF